MNDQPFIRGEGQPDPIPLGEYLPSFRDGVVSTWLNRLPSRPDLVISPFGSSPQGIIEAARAGFRVLVPVHNPIIRFLINRLARPVSRDELNTALVKLASSFKGRERLKPYILSLYETECPHCGATISARSFTWSKSNAEPIRKTCLCHECGEPTEIPVNQEDIQKTLAYHENSPFHARALTRVTAPDDPMRFQVENALRIYPPRTVYALFTILNKLTGFDLTPEESMHLDVLLLHAFYRCSSPKTYHEKESPLDTTVEVDSYQEENVWYALEEALDAWSTAGRVLPVSTWPDLSPETGGITIFPGRARELIPLLHNVDIHAALMVFPKPNLPFWALSALWTGWLWGQEAAAPLRNYLSLQEPDWVWLTRAIESTLSELKTILPAGSNCFGLLPEAEIQYLISVMTSSLAAGFSLENIAVDPDLQLIQAYWIPGEKQDNVIDTQPHKDVIRTAGFQFLESVGEPKHTLYLYSAGLAALASKGILSVPSGTNLEDLYNQLEKDFEESIAYRQGFLYYTDSETWWHQELKLSPNPQSDQLEQALVTYLVGQNSPAEESNLYSALNEIFPGLNTPQGGLIEVCLKSYAEKPTGSPSGWRLRASDQPAKRRDDILEIEAILTQLGNQLGFKVEKGEPLGNIIRLIWQTGNKTRFTYFISASGFLNKILTDSDSPPENPWIILPGSRAELIHYKMGANPPLAMAIMNSWGLVKYRHIRRIVEEGSLTQENLQERLALDPFTSDAPQLPLI